MSSVPIEWLDTAFESYENVRYETDAAGAETATPLLLAASDPDASVAVTTQRTVVFASAETKV